LQLIATDRAKISSFGNKGNSALKLHHIIQTRPIFSVPAIKKILEDQGRVISEPTAYSAVSFLENVGIVREITGKPRHRMYIYSEYMKILDEGTQPIAKD